MHGLAVAALPALVMGLALYYATVPRSVFTPRSRRPYLARWALLWIALLIAMLHGFLTITPG